MSRRRQAKITKGVFPADIETLSHDGRGIARIDGKATFIAGALPGEEVEFSYTQHKKDFDEGTLINIKAASPLRVKPDCPHFNMCGGCTMQHIQAQAQIKFKETFLLDLLQRLARVAPETLLPPLTSEPWHYRHKARLSVRHVIKKAATLIGFREKNNPRFIADISQCPVLHRKVDKALPALRALLDSFEDLHSIAQIEVAAGDKDIALIFRNMQPLSTPDAAKLREFAEQAQMIILLQPGGPETVEIFHPPAHDGFLTYEYEDITYRFYPTDFTQVNLNLNQQMITQALQLLDLQPQDRALDLFCGLGNFTLPMAKRCQTVVGVEGSAAMVERAKHNAALNHLNNVTFYAANLEQIAGLSTIIKHQSFDKLLLDPARLGALDIVKHIQFINPARIVYVSCNPATLARDTDILVNQQGFRLKAAGVLDMFPHTTHVESMALFERS
ncbi:MAG: 23S rRNA (uracil(1939)-C(5))-methyltransferase RlmD [Legionellaceae bacterium]|nr:23S rRNA (uracil(1939)-C(5))-methyltransferase RlmD [Legionellaceae bacterium]HCA90135.1 23S rRNA (uracil(1939)-C(5))-methyltransferase RlmD [Legionellales bacterium]|tara:strand:- start:1838 stop:3172 length:1335 start_codon:yes stop_codon:yes gene_type:complete